MRLFVCEYVTGGGFAGSELPGGLIREAELMLSSLVRDLAAAGYPDVVFSRDARLAAPDWPGTLLPVTGADDCWRVWAAAMRRADAVWPIAPETDGLLERLSAAVLAADRLLLGSAPEAVRLCASKLATARHLAAHGLRTVPTCPLTPGTAADPPPSRDGWVVKPDDGAGAEDTFLFRGATELAGLDPARTRGGRFVVQPFIAGEPVSLCLICRDGQAALLACNRQSVAVEDGRFRIRGWSVGGMEAERARYQPLAAAVAAAMPGLRGYVGVDLIDTEQGPVVLEVNPRLTTTYAGLGEAIGGNPAALVMAVAQGGGLPPVGAVRAHRIALPQPDPGLG